MRLARSTRPPETPSYYSLEQGLTQIANAESPCGWGTDTHAVDCEPNQGSDQGRRHTAVCAGDILETHYATTPLLEALVVVQLDDLRGRYVQVLVDLAREVLVEQRLELAVLLLQLGDLVGVGPGVGLGLGLGLGLG